jgi:hypothetical protein
VPGYHERGLVHFSRFDPNAFRYAGNCDLNGFC